MHHQELRFLQKHEHLLKKRDQDSVKCQNQEDNINLSLLKIQQISFGFYKKACVHHQELRLL